VLYNSCVRTTSRPLAQHQWEEGCRWATLARSLPKQSGRSGLAETCRLQAGEDERPVSYVPPLPLPAVWPNLFDASSTFVRCAQVSIMSGKPAETIQTLLEAEAEAKLVVEKARKGAFFFPRLLKGMDGWALLCAVARGV